MGRTRGKGKKPNVISSQEDLGSGEEEKAPFNKRRGRPIKPLKDDHEKEEEELKESDEDAKGLIFNNDLKSEKGRKRKRAVKEEKGDAAKSTVSIGFRQNGSRRKNKPRRAAEAMVECN